MGTSFGATNSNSQSQSSIYVNWHNRNNNNNRLTQSKSVKVSYVCVPPTEETGTKCFSIVTVTSLSLSCGPSMLQKVPSTHIFPLIFRAPSNNITLPSSLASEFTRSKFIESEEHLKLISFVVVRGGTVSFTSISNCSSFHEYASASPSPPYSVVDDVVLEFRSFWFDIDINEDDDEKACDIL